MAKPNLRPLQTTSAVVLPSYGTRSKAEATGSYAFGIYVEPASALYDGNFISGAIDQVAHTYRKLGGDVLDIELTEESVYSSYEEAVLEYSYLINIHQAKNALPNALGHTTGTFDHDGQISGSSVSSNLSLYYPRFKFEYSKRVAEGLSEKTGIGGHQRIYSASYATKTAQQDYDLQALISASSGDSVDYANKVGDKKIVINKVFYKSPHAMWRFYGYYGGLNAVGNLSTYGMYADDSTFEVIPTWQNKLQAMAYEDAIYTRNSHYSYELKDNRLRIFPQTSTSSPEKFWVEFYIEDEAWDEEPNKTIGVKGISNLNTLPFANIPYKNINSIGKQWIRRFSLALAKETLGQIRGKFGNIPIPGNEVTLNADALMTQAREEQEKLREELKTILDELTYAKMAETDAAIIRNTKEVMQNIPYGVYVG